MSETTVPGVCAKHKIVTPECSRVWGGDGAARRALEELMLEYQACNNQENRDAGATFHFMLTVERDS